MVREQLPGGLLGRGLLLGPCTRLPVEDVTICSSDVCKMTRQGPCGEVCGCSGGVGEEDLYLLLPPSFPSCL